MAAGPIPFTAIVEYSKVYPVGEFEEFHYVIRVMDNSYLRVEEEKFKAANKKSQPSRKK